MSGDARAARSRGLACGRSRLVGRRRAPRTETLVPLTPRKDRRLRAGRPADRLVHAEREGLQHRARPLASSTVCRLTCRSRRDSHNVTCRWTIAAVARDTRDRRRDVERPLDAARELPAPVRLPRSARASHRARARAPLPGVRPHEAGATGSGSAASQATERRSPTRVTSVDYDDEAGCLAGTASCVLKIVGGGVYRVVGRKPKLVPGTGRGAVEIAASGGRIAYVGTGAISQAGQARRGSRPADPGRRCRRAVTSSRASSPRGRRSRSRSRHTCSRRSSERRSVFGWPGTRRRPVSRSARRRSRSRTSPQLAVTDRLVVFHVGRSIRAVEIATGRIKTLIEAAAPPVGLSIEGSRRRVGREPEARRADPRAPRVLEPRPRSAGALRARRSPRGGAPRAGRTGPGRARRRRRPRSRSPVAAPRRTGGR